MPSSRRYQQFRSFVLQHRRGTGWLIVTALAIFLPVLYTPYWQTHDDPWIAMQIFGYGLAEAPAINIPLSNFAWAWLVQQFPEFLDISAYTWALYSCTWLALLVIWNVLRIRKKMFFVKLIFLICLCFYAFLNPQYTVTAFYCAIAGILTLCFPLKRYTWGRVVIIALMIVLSFIIRQQCLFPILIIGLIYVPWRLLARDKKALFCALLTMALTGSLYYADHSLKSGAEQLAIADWHDMRVKLSDGQVGDMLAHQPAILEKFGLSKNDMRMLCTQFSGDANLRDLGRLKKMCAEIPPHFYFFQKFEEIKKTFLHFMDAPLFFLVTAIILLLAARIDRKRAVTILLFIGEFILIGYMSRGGSLIDRVYFPLSFYVIALLLLTGNSHNSDDLRILFDIQVLMGKRKYGTISNRKILPVATSFLLIITIMSFSGANLMQQWRISQYDIPASRAAFDNSFRFGIQYPVHWLYPPFASLSAIKALKFQASCWPLVEPSSRKYFDHKDPLAFKKFLSAGYRFAMGEEDLKKLRIYCKEHLAGELEYKLESEDRSLPIYWARCVPDKR